MAGMNGARYCSTIWEIEFRFTNFPLEQSDVARYCLPKRCRDLIPETGLNLAVGRYHRHD